MMHRKFQNNCYHYYKYVTWLKKVPFYCYILSVITKYTVTQKNWTLSFEHNFGKYYLILIIVSLLQTKIIIYLPTKM